MKKEHYSNFCTFEIASLVNVPAQCTLLKEICFYYYLVDFGRKERFEYLLIMIPQGLSLHAVVVLVLVFSVLFKMPLALLCPMPSLVTSMPPLSILSY